MKTHTETHTHTLLRLIDLMEARSSIIRHFGFVISKNQLCNLNTHAKQLTKYIYQYW